MALELGQRIRLGWLAGFGVLLAVLALRGDEPGATSSSSSSSSTTPATKTTAGSPTTTTTATTSGELVRSCEELESIARTGGDEAVALGWLCPDVALSPVMARAVLLGTSSPREAGAAAARLDAHPELAALARFAAARTPVDAPPLPPLPWPALPRPEETSVSPIDDEVVGLSRAARARLYTKGIEHEARTRAHAYLAKVALQAMLALGVRRDRPAPPFARLLATLGLHHGRLAASAHWRRRITGLAPVIAQIEDGMLDALLVLQATPHAGDAGRLIDERGRARTYLRLEGPRRRITARREGSPTMGSPEAVWGMADEVERLVAHGWVDRAVEHVAATARDPEGPGVVVLEQMLQDALLRTDRVELAARARSRLGRVREGLPQAGPGPVPARHVAPYATAEAVADEAGRWLAHAVDPSLTAWTRRYAATRAVLSLRTRPDATAVLLELATTGPPDAARIATTPLLVALLETHDPGRLATQRLAGAAAQSRGGTRSRADIEAARRRRFAVALRTP